MSRVRNAANKDKQSWEEDAWIRRWCPVAMSIRIPTRRKDPLDKIPGYTWAPSYPFPAFFYRRGAAA